MIIRYIFAVLLVFFLPLPALFAAEYPPVVGVALSKVVPLMEKEKYQEAATLLQQVLTKADGRHKEVYMLLAHCAMQQGQAARAAKAYSDALRLDESDPLLWLNLGKAQYEQKNYALAAGSFHTAWQKETPAKRQADVLFYSGAAWMMAGKQNKALTVFHELFAAYPKEIKTEWREQYIHALIGSGEVKKALPLIRQMIAETSGEKRMRWQEVLLAQYVELKMYRQAVKLARSLTEEAPGEKKWWKALAHVQLAAGKMEEALVALLAYSYLTPLDERTQALLADLYLETGIPAKAAPLYEKGLQKGSRKTTLQRLVIALHRQDKDDKALQILQRYRSETDRSKTLLQLEGEMHYGRREFGLAAASYSRAAGLPGSHQGQCWLMAGYAALQHKDLHLAKRYLRKALAFSRQKKSAASALQIVESRLEQLDAKQLAAKDVQLP